MLLKMTPFKWFHWKHFAIYFLIFNQINDFFHFSPNTIGSELTENCFEESNFFLALQSILFAQIHFESTFFHAIRLEPDKNSLSSITQQLFSVFTLNRQDFFTKNLFVDGLRFNFIHFVPMKNNGAFHHLHPKWFAKWKVEEKRNEKQFKTRRKNVFLCTSQF